MNAYHIRVEDFVGEADRRGLVRILVRKLHIHLEGLGLRV
jgi:hypothetical protein